MTEPKPQVRAEREGPIGWIVIDNPARHNALTAEMFSAFARALAAYGTDDEVRVIVVRGAGDRAFASGADIGQLGSDIRAPKPVDRSGTDGSAALFPVDKPVVAMIHGYCIGGGLLVALTADIRVAADDARFGIPAARLGVAYPSEGVRRLVAAVGPAAASEILFTGDRFSADDAARWGLVSRVVPKADLETTVRALAIAIAAGAPLSIRASKAAIQAGDPTQVEALIEACWESEDFAEGLRAFAEKRAPEFRGR